VEQTVSRPSNDTLLRALRRQPTEQTPVWLMRQAGRYLPEYCETRRRAGSFLQLCKNPALACEVTLQPLARYDLDAAILFSDILTVPDAMGLGLFFTDGEGPRFERPLREEWAIRDLTAPDPWDHLRYVTDAVAEIRRALHDSVPLIGFSGSPYTLACYMVEGGASSDYRHIKSMLYGRPDLLHRILSVTADAVTSYLNAQIESGAQAVMIFDSWGGSLSAAAYQEFSLSYLRRIVDGLIRERGVSRYRRSSSPRAAACGWNRLPTAVATGSVSTGRSTSAKRAVVSVGVLRCKGTSIRLSSSLPRSRSPPKPGRSSPATVPTVAAMSSILDTGYRSSRRRKTSEALIDAVHQQSRDLRRAGNKLTLGS
jgi:uroporphyrinogen decarboxylase